MSQISSLMAAPEGPVAEFSRFANFEEKKRKLNLLMSFPKIVNQMVRKGQNCFFASVGRFSIFWIGLAAVAVVVVACSIKIGKKEQSWL